MIEEIKPLLKLCLGLVASLLICPKVALAQQVPSSNENPYPAEFSADYIKDCTASAQAQGLSDTESFKYCNCTLNKIKEIYTFEEILEINSEVEKTQQIPSSLEGVISFCGETLLKPR